MNDRNDNKMKAAESGLTALQRANNVNVWNPSGGTPPVPAFVDGVDDLAAVLGRVNTLPEGDSRAATQTKADAEMLLEVGCERVSNNGYLYFSALAKHYRGAGDQALAAKATERAQVLRFRRVDFTDVRDRELRDRATMIFLQVAVLVAAPSGGWPAPLGALLAAGLADGSLEADGGVPPVPAGTRLVTAARFNITTADVQILAAARNVFDDWLAEPAAAIGRRKTQVRETLPALLDELDQAVDFLRRLTPNFDGTAEGRRMVGEFENALVIHDTGSRGNGGGGSGGGSGGGATPTAPGVPMGLSQHDESGVTFVEATLPAGATGLKLYRGAAGPEQVFLGEFTTLPAQLSLGGGPIADLFATAFNAAGQSAQVPVPA